MTTLLVLYAGDLGTRFDRNYYIASHLPMVRRAWGPHRLESAAAFFPDGDDEGTIALCVCEFRDEAALTAALGAAQTEQVMADVAHFTDVQPTQRRAVPL